MKAKKAVPAELLSTLDEESATAPELAAVLGTTVSEVERGLDALREDGLVVQWADLWATSWRAKLRLHRTFFQRAIPLSLAVGASVTALSAALYAPDGWADRAVPALVVVATIAALVAGWTLVRR